MMKCFAAFFALYLLVLSVLPCTDRGICDADLRVQHSSAAAQQKPSAHDHDTEEVCSPFCVCACCGQVLNIAQLPDAPALQQAVPVVDKPSAYYPPQLLSAYHINIWQPPRAC